jgi:hypothetical protein
VILGAGASSSVPKTDTESLTKVIVDARYSNNNGEYPIYEWLRDLDSSNTTFEKLMAEAWRFKEEIRRTGSIPDALRGYMPGWEPPCVNDLLGKALSEAAHHIGMHLYEALQANQGPASVTDFLDDIARQSRMIVGTLNYEDLIVRGNTTYNYGYTDSLFDYYFSQQSMEAQAGQPSLLWLHGSIHLNRQFASERPGELAWMHDAKASLRGWVQGFRDNIFDFPIIIATDKPTQLIQTPFLDYWYVLNHALRMTKVVVVVGYSGNDEHLNRLLLDAATVGQRNICIVWSTKANSGDDVLKTLVKVFPTLINPYCPLESIAPGRSLQPLINPPASVPCPRLLVDMDGICDLASNVDSVLDLL